MYFASPREINPLDVTMNNSGGIFQFVDAHVNASCPREVAIRSLLAASNTARYNSDWFVN